MNLGFRCSVRLIGEIESDWEIVCRRGRGIVRIYAAV